MQKSYTRIQMRKLENMYIFIFILYCLFIQGLSDFLKTAENFQEFIQGLNEKIENSSLENYTQVIKSLIIQYSTYKSEKIEESDFEILDHPFIKDQLHEIFQKLPKKLNKIQNVNFTIIPLLASGTNQEIFLRKSQIFNLLISAFFWLIPKRPKLSGDFPDINFERIFHKKSNESGVGAGANCKVEKLKCILNYFLRMTDRDFEIEGNDGEISFERRYLEKTQIPNWKKSNKSLIEVEIRNFGFIEDCKGMVQVDFANKYIGGGILGNGCTQEEILFSISPELIVSRAFTAPLEDAETLKIKGFEQFSTYSGYKNSFKYAGNFQEVDSEFDTELVAMDALYFKKDESRKQFTFSNVHRELGKAYSGFSIRENEKFAKGIATGNWGCGVFNGNPELKFLIQLMAASQAQRPVLVMHTFGNGSQARSIDEILYLFKKTKLRVGQIYKFCVNFYEFFPKAGQNGLFDYIKMKLSKLK